MKRSIKITMGWLMLLLLVSACFQKDPDRSDIEQKASKPPHLPELTTVSPNNGLTLPEKQFKRALIRKYQNQTPSQWGENVTGVKRKMKTTEKVVALTFDACGGNRGSRYDSKLIDYLIREQIPATLFINGRWIDDNYDVFMKLAQNPLFEIENHGHLHKPLSVNGKSAWGITGTQNIGEVVDEVLINESKIQNLTGRRPIFFRSGTAYYDNIATQIVNELGVRAVNFNVLGDAGATFTAEQIRQAFLTVIPGSVIICHMNHPEKDTTKGVMLGIPELRKKGFRFVKLDTYPLEG